MHCHFSVRGFAFVHTCLQLYLYACIVYTHNNIRTHIIQKYMKMYNTLSHLPLVHPFFMFPFYTYTPEKIIYFFLQCTILLLTSLHLVSFHLVSLHLVSLHLVSLHLVSLHFPSLHLVSLHLVSSYISLHVKVLPFLRLHHTLTV